jgi:hypothetical protein
MALAIKRFTDYRPYLPIRWTAVALFATLIAYADGFWLTSLQGVIGAIERNEPPFMRWLRDSTLMLPLVVLAVLLALACSRRLIQHSQHNLVRFGITALLVALISSAIGIAEVAASSARDYQLQVQHLELMHSYGGAVAQPAAIDLAGFGSAPYALYCNLRGAAANNAVTLLEYATFNLHVRAVFYAGLLLLTTNLVLASGILALLKDRGIWSAAANGFQ